MSTVAGKVRMTLKGAWNSAQAYEILDVVMSADGVSAYMAKKDVPAGTALTNTEYWDAFLSVDDAVAAANAAASAANNAATNANAAADEARAATAELSNETVSIIDKVTSPFTATGSIIQCHPVEGYPLDATVHLEPVQEGEGDPYPAGGGRNLLYFANGTRESNGVSGVVESGKISASGTATSTYVNLTYFTAINIVNDNSYTVSVENAQNHNIAFRFATDTTDTVFKDIVIPAGQTYATFTADNDYIHCRIFVRDLSAGSVIGVSDMGVQIEAGSTATDYAPYSNIRPISGHTGCEVVRCGKNLLENTATTHTLNGVTFTVGEDGTITASGTNALTSMFLFSIGYITLKAGVKYALSGCPAGGGTESYQLTLRSVTGSDVFADETGNGKEFTPDEDVEARLNIRIAPSATVGPITFKPMIRLASDTDSTYEPYTGDTYAVTLPETVYGGTVRVSEGETEDDTVLITLTGEDGAKMTGTSGVRSQVFGFDNTLDILKPATVAVVADALSSHFKVASWNALINGSMFDVFAIHENGSVGFAYDGTIDECNAWLKAQNAAGTPVQFAVKRKTPTTLTTDAHTIPALDGLNTVYADAGDVTVKGRIDPEYLNNSLLERIAALEAAALN